MSALEKALRAAKNASKVNLFRNRARGGWDATVSRIGSETRFSVGYSEDPVEALLQALAASAAGTHPEADGIAAVSSPVPEAAPPAFSKGIFG